MAYTIGINNECRMSALIVNNSDEVRKFVKIRYTRSEENVLGWRVRHLQDKRHTIIVDFAATVDHEPSVVQIDYVFGEFLVNGMPMGRLPASITKHAIFGRIFGNTTFEVQAKNQTFSTLSVYRNHMYIFREDINDGIVVIEHKVDVMQSVNVDSTVYHKELIPHTRLIGLVPFLLLERYSHWYNREDDVIEFRPKLFSDPDFASVNGIQYELDLKTRRLKHMKTKRLLLDVRSESFKKIAELMERLEHPNYINVLMESPFGARVELTRMKLTFLIDCLNSESGYNIQSNEYSSMRVSSKQNIGTLFGLHSGLLLESMDAETVKSQLFIVPHAKINVQRMDYHVEVKIVAPDTELRSPPFFIYHINKQLRTLKGNSFAAWFYLAHLHAVTSYPLPDTFTGITGVERALQILQSGLAWSSEPYDKESMSTLQSLADLSPIRRFQTKMNKKKGHHQQMTQWPSHVYPHSAHDAFILIVRKLISDSVRLAHLFMPNQKKPSLKTYTTASLTARSYTRYVPYTPNCSISETFIKSNDRIHHFIATENDQNMQSVRELAANFSVGTFCVPISDQPIDELLFGLFSSEKVLTGRTEEQTPIFIQNFCSSSSFANLWIDLYEYIRQKQLSAEQLHLILTLLAFKGNNVRQLLVLQAIAANPMEFEKCKAPPYQMYTDVSSEFDAEAIKKAIDLAKIPIDTFIERIRRKCTNDEFPAKEKGVRKRYNKQIGLIKEKVVAAVDCKWPCESIDIASIELPPKVHYVNVRNVSDGVNELLSMWDRNQKLRDFTKRIDKIFATKLKGSSPFTDQPEWPVCAANAHPFPKYKINFDAKMCEDLTRYSIDIELARRIFIENNDDERTLQQLWERFREISCSPSNEHLVCAELWPRMVPTIIFPRLLHTKNIDQRNFIGALAVMTRRAQQAIRNDGLNTATNVCIEKWKPHEHPKWLLYEIEMDLSIRRVQVRIRSFTQFV